MKLSNIQKYNIKDKMKNLNAGECYKIFEILKEDICFKYSIKNDTLIRINELLKNNIDKKDDKLTYNSYFDEKYNNTSSYKLKI